MEQADLTRALDQIAEIHGQMAKGESYRGYRPAPVALSGLFGAVAAALQARFVPAGDTAAFLRFWVTVGSACAAVAASGVIAHFIVNSDSFARRRTLHVVGQLAPSLLAGAIVTRGIACSAPDQVHLLPGIWALIFGLGVFASRPYLPRIAGWVALWYFAAGAWQLMHPQPLGGGPAWPIAITFGLGQLAAAVMLYFDIQRSAYNVQD